MSELGKRAGEIQNQHNQFAEEQQRHDEDAQAELEEKQRISAERLNVFVTRMNDANIPKIPIYIEEQYTPPNHTPGFSRVSPMGYTRLDEGWIVQDFRDQTYDDGHPGLFVSTDKKVYTCRETSNRPPVGAAERYRRDWQPGEYAMVNYRHEHGHPYGFDDSTTTIFSDDQGLDILAHALVRYDVVG
jgi:hypothetical protein